MAQFSGQDMKKALSELGNDGGSEPLLRPEQVERIKALANESDPGVKAEKTMAMMDQLIREAASVSERFQQVLSGLGLEAGHTSSFLAGDKLSPEARAEVAQARSAYQEQVEAEVEQAAKAATGGAKRTSSRSARPGRLRI